ncbi:FxsA family protein [Paracoccaceae bacterium GXU_MW_L88]
MPLFLIFLIIPIIEIGLFIQLGGIIGLWPTLLCVVLTAVIGSALVRRQGLGVLQELQGQSGSSGGNPLSPLAHGLMILMAGMLLITPGFFTDACGFALLVPAIRRMIIAKMGHRITVVATSFGGASQAGYPGAEPRPRRSHPDIIEGEIIDEKTPEER